MAGHLNRELKVFYSEPTWKIEVGILKWSLFDIREFDVSIMVSQISTQADDWQETRGDGVIGNCYSLDLSQRIDPGQQYVLHLVLFLDKACFIFLKQLILRIYVQGLQ